MESPEMVQDQSEPFDNNSTDPQPWVLDPAVHLDNLLIAGDFFFGAVGIPLNVCVAGFIIVFRRLHSPRHFTLLGILFSNAFLLAAHMVEGVAACWSPAKSLASWLCSWLLDLALPNLILNYFVSLIERQLCLKHFSWHKLNVTNRWILLAQVGSFLILTAALKGHHLLAFGALPFQWEMNQTNINVMSSSIVIGFLVSLAAQLAVWTISSRAHAPRVEVISLQQFHVATGVDHETSNSDDNPFVFIGDERVSRQDLETSRNVTISFLTLLASTAPALISLIFLAICINDNQAATSCTWLIRLVYYLRGFILTHTSLVSPLVVSRSRDIRATLSDRVAIQCLV